MSTWGEYLCYGCTKMDITSSLSENDDTTPDFQKKESILFSRLEKAFRMLGLTPFSTRVVLQFTLKLIQEEDGPKKMQHILSYLLRIVTSAQITGPNGMSPHPGQQGCPQVIPGLRAKPFWHVTGHHLHENFDEFPWIAEIESKIDAIKAELTNLQEYHLRTLNHYSQKMQENISFQKYRDDEGTENGDGATVGRGNWHIAYLDLHGVLGESPSLPIDDSKQKPFTCPITRSLLRSCLGDRYYHHSFFSSLSADTIVKPHRGSTNKKLRFYLPLYLPSQGSCWLEVGGERIYLTAGKAIIFDDSFLHSAGHERLCTDLASQTVDTRSEEGSRMVLIADFWHPDLYTQEIRVLQYITKQQLAAAKRLAIKQGPQQQQEPSENSQGKASDNFLTVIRRSKEEGISLEAIEEIWGKQSGDERSSLLRERLQEER